MYLSVLFLDKLDLLTSPSMILSV